jgi:asparagine synthase (glutamine-hydrolysing)
VGQTSRLSFKDAAEALREAFLDSVRLHLRSDVPLGAALSGGIDSSAIVCAMRHVEPDMPIHTFSYIAQGSSLSEEEWVDRVGVHTGAFAHKVVATPEDLVRDIDTIVRAQGEPFGSTSIYAQYRVYQLAREQGVTVTLDGQGADELLAGYEGYPGDRMLSLLETPGEGLLAAGAFARQWGEWPGRSQCRAWMHMGRAVLPDGPYAHARRLMGRGASPEWLNADVLIDAGVTMSEPRPVRAPDARGRRVVEQLAQSLQSDGLPHLLRHGDRNSMRFSVESRVPFLTIPMAELALSLPEDYLISGSGETKSVFRAAMRGIVPDAILDRRDKIGFATPEREWFIKLASQSREWLQDADQVPFLHREPLLKAFDAIVAGHTPFSWQAWRWINYIRWYAMFAVGRA